MKRNARAVMKNASIQEPASLVFPESYAAGKVIIRLINLKGSILAVTGHWECRRPRTALTEH